MEHKIRGFLVGGLAFSISALLTPIVANAGQGTANYQKYLDSVSLGDLRARPVAPTGMWTKRSVLPTHETRDPCRDLCRTPWQSSRLDKQLRAEMDAFNRSMSATLLGQDFPGQLAIEIRRRPQLSMRFHFD